MKHVTTALAVFCSLFALYGAFGSMITQISRFVHVMMILMLTFLFYPAARRWKERGTCLRHRPGRADLRRFCLPLPRSRAVHVPGRQSHAHRHRHGRPGVHPGPGGDTPEHRGRPADPGRDLHRLRHVWGAYLPEPWGHRGYTITRIIALEYMTLNGLFGTPVEVSSTFIILFTIFGAVLEVSGAGKFFVDFALGCMGKSRAGAGRAVTLASFLLGTVSGSGAATTVTLGSVAWPLLKRSGYDKESAGGLLAAGGIGAILSPPVLGAASFLIAEILKISYLEVLIMASHPDAPLLCLHPVHGGGGCPAFPSAAGVSGKDRRGGPDPAVLVPFRFAGDDRHLHGLRLHRHYRRLLQHPDRHRDELFQPEVGALPEETDRGARRRHQAGAERGRHLRLRRHHRRGHQPDRHRVEVFRDHRGPRRRQPLFDPDPHGGDPPDPRASPCRSPPPTSSPRS